MPSPRDAGDDFFGGDDDDGDDVDLDDDGRSVGRYHVTMN